MSQIILDDQLFDLDVLIPIARWNSVQRLRDLRPTEVIKDDRVPLLLRELNGPTFVTIDMGFWNRSFVDAQYCVLCFPLRTDEQYKIPELLRKLFGLAEFRTRNLRMGKVARVSLAQIQYWQVKEQHLYQLNWPK